jgi:hypothetical protein
MVNQIVHRVLGDGEALGAQIGLQPMRRKASRRLNHVVALNPPPLRSQSKAIRRKVPFQESYFRKLEAAWEGQSESALEWLRQYQDEPIYGVGQGGHAFNDLALELDPCSFMKGDTARPWKFPHISGSMPRDRLFLDGSLQAQLQAPGTVGIESLTACH